jgi:hypothetical protein
MHLFPPKVGNAHLDISQREIESVMVISGDMPVIGGRGARCRRRGIKWRGPKCLPSTENVNRFGDDYWMGDPAINFDRERRWNRRYGTAQWADRRRPDSDNGAMTVVILSMVLGEICVTMIACQAALHPASRRR